MNIQKLKEELFELNMNWEFFVDNFQGSKEQFKKSELTYIDSYVKIVLKFSDGDLKDRLADMCLYFERFRDNFKGTQEQLALEEIEFIKMFKEEVEEFIEE